MTLTPDQEARRERQLTEAWATWTLIPWFDQCEGCWEYRRRPLTFRNYKGQVKAHFEYVHDVRLLFPPEVVFENGN